MSTFRTAGAELQVVNDTRFQLRKRGTSGADSWRDLPGLRAARPDPGTAEEISVDTVQGTLKDVGLPEPGPLTLEFGVVVTEHQSWLWLDENFREGDEIEFQWEVPGETLQEAVAGTNTIAIDQDGDPTFLPSAVQPKWGTTYKHGAVVRTGATAATYVYHFVRDWSTTGANRGTPRFEPRSAALSATDYAIVRAPKVMPVTAAKIMSMPQPGFAAKEAFGQDVTIVLQTQDLLPRVRPGVLSTA